jgi:hypothetical protein
MVPTVLAVFVIPAWCAMSALAIIPLTRVYVRVLLAIGRGYNGAPKLILLWSVAIVMIALLMIPIAIAIVIAVSKRSADETFLPLTLWAVVCLVAIFIPCYRIVHIRNADALRQVGFLK